MGRGESREGGCNGRGERMAVRVGREKTKKVKGLPVRGRDERGERIFGMDG